MNWTTDVIALCGLVIWGAFLMMNAAEAWVRGAAKTVAASAFVLGFGGVGFALGVLLGKFIWWTLVNP